MRWSALVASAIITTVTAQELPPAIEARLRALEEQVAQLKTENEQLRRDLGLEVVARQPDVRSSGAASAVQVGGLLQAQAEEGAQVDQRFPDDRPRFFLRRARVNLSGRFVDDFSFRTEIELAGSQGAASGVRAQLTDVFVTWTRYLGAAVRVGQFKTPFGFEQLYQDPRLFTIERSLANDRLTVSRQIGVQVAGDILPDRFSYAAGAFNGTGTNITTNDNKHFLVAGRLAGTPLLTTFGTNVVRVTAGVDGYETRDTGLTVGPEFGIDSTPSTPARDNLFTGRRTGAGADVQIAIGNLELWTEYLRATFEPDAAVPAHRFHSSGWYAQAAWLTLDNRLQLVAKLDAFDPVQSRLRDETRTLTLGINYLLRGDDLKLQFDWLRSRTGAGDHSRRLLARVQTIF
jgi:phosphate-selective porin OprO/OprP